VPHTKSAAALIVLAAICAAAPAPSAETPANAFKKHWTGRQVVVQRPLFTLVYDELGRVGAAHRGKREGLVVATPSKGAYLLFAGRQSHEDIVDSDADRLIDRVKAAYRRNEHVQIGFTHVVTPLHVIQYVRGITLVVNRVEIDRAAVTLVLNKPEPTTEFATTLTVQWPAPLSKDLEERDPLERVIEQFLLPRATKLGSVGIPNS
jgi:hypothetical protein